MSFSPDEVWFLRDHQPEINQQLMQCGLNKKSAFTDAQLLRSAFGDYGRAVMELGTARYKAAGKLPHTWLMCHDSAQQATPMTVAQVRAQRIKAQFPEALVHDVTCSIGTEGVACIANNVEYIGSDLDFSRVLMAQANIPSGIFLLADALRSPIRASVVIADPARRTSGRRIARPEELLPPLPDLLAAHDKTPIAVKCAPGLDFSSWPGLVSVVSVDGGVKEACLYSPEFIKQWRREAVVLKTTASGETTQDLIHDAMCDDIDAGPIGQYVIDPDGAIVRAGLVRHYGYREGLWMLDERVAYLTGPQIPAGASGFEYLETVPIKKLKTALRSHNCGSVEILVRGVAVDPDELRKRLALKGSVPRTVVLTRIGSTAVALVCRARETTTSE